MKVLTAALAAALLVVGSAAFAECNWTTQEVKKPQTVVELPPVPEDDAES